MAVRQIVIGLTFRLIFLAMLVLGILTANIASAAEPPVLMPSSSGQCKSGGQLMGAPYARNIHHYECDGVIVEIEVHLFGGYVLNRVNLTNNSEVDVWDVTFGVLGGYNPRLDDSFLMIRPDGARSIPSTPNLYFAGKVASGEWITFSFISTPYGYREGKELESMISEMLTASWGANHSWVTSSPTIDLRYGAS